MTLRTRTSPGSLSIGTSGWSYDGWRNVFYPSELPKKNWLTAYSSQFSSTEINSSCYRTPTLKTATAWRDQTPRLFTFARKASKFITHWKRLGRNCENSIALMQSRLDVLGSKLAVILFQLPPNFSKDKERLCAFLNMLPPGYRYAFEFREKSWYSAEVFDTLHLNGVALCISDHADAPAPWYATARHVYISGHGPAGNYRDKYSSRTLRRWADAALEWINEGRDVFVYFDNNQKAAAPTDARRLLKITRRANEQSVPR
jgi:uncharacterized protein YecE (DUF72 family)